MLRKTVLASAALLLGALHALAFAPWNRPWLQLAALRAGTARQQIEDAAVSGRVREVCQEIAAHVAATEEVQAAMQTMKASAP